VNDMQTTLASRRFQKTWFDTKNDWATHPPAVYVCPFCAADTHVTRGDLESAVDRKGQPEQQEHVQTLRAACLWVWRDGVQYVHPFRCSGCHRLVLLGFDRSRFRRTGHMFRLGMVGEQADPSESGEPPSTERQARAGPK
jgi:hypothetical protein